MSNFWLKHQAVPNKSNNKPLNVSSNANYTRKTNNMNRKVYKPMAIRRGKSTRKNLRR